VSSKRHQKTGSKPAPKPVAKQKQRNQSKGGSIRLEFAPESPTTAFGGMALTEKLARRAGLWGALDRLMPTRRGYDWTTIVKSLAVGLMTGPRGTFAAEDVRQDPVLQKLVGLNDGVPEEATVWRSLAQLAETPGALETLEKETRSASKRLLEAVPLSSLGPEGFVSLFIDGTLLEGSERREGTKTLRDKGTGLLWTTAFVGPVPVCARLCPQGEGEQTAARELLKKTHRDVLEPAGLSDRALVLMDSLHGNGPSLNAIEELSLAYVVGAGALTLAEQVLSEQPESQWVATPEFDKRRAVEGSAVCVATLQCEGWEQPRTLVGRRWNNPNELFLRQFAVLTNLTPEHPQVASLMERKKNNFAEAVLWLYDRKGKCETYFKGMLNDLGLHHPPCQSWKANTAFYAIGIVAGMLSAVTALLDPEGKKRGLPTIATVRRRLWSVAASVTRHARTTVATVLGLSEEWRQEIEGTWRRIARC
jgi:hypothetical protein